MSRRHPWLERGEAGPRSGRIPPRPPPSQPAATPTRPPADTGWPLSTNQKGSAPPAKPIRSRNRWKMSQLQALLNDSLIRTKHVENAAIININERKVCASTIGFYVPPENAINLIYTFYNNLMQVRREGLYFKQKHYKCVRADEYSIYLKNPDGGLIAVKTNAFILIATYKVGMYPSVCVEAVEKLDYFRDKGS